MTDQASAGMPARRTRRQLLAGGTGALAAVLTAEAIARPAPAAAANGDNVILGQSNTETTDTDIRNTTDGVPALICDATGNAVAIIGRSDSGVGVHGTAGNSFGSGVFGTAAGDGDGVIGQANGNGNGMTGQASNASASGVYGQNTGTGFGVAGRAVAGVGTLGDSAGGVGVWANSQNATALKVTGTARFVGTAQFSRSGILTIAAGKSSATRTGVTLTSASLVLATIQQDRPGVWVRSAVPNVGRSSFTVHLSKPAPARTRVAWFVVN